MPPRFESSGLSPFSGFERAPSNARWSPFSSLIQDTEEPPSLFLGIGRAASEGARASNRLFEGAFPMLGRTALSSKPETPEVDLSQTSEEHEIFSRAHTDVPTVEPDSPEAFGQPLTGARTIFETGGDRPSGPPPAAPDVPQEDVVEAGPVTDEAHFLNGAEVIKLRSKTSRLASRLDNMDDINPDLPQAVGALRDHISPSKMALSDLSDSAWQEQAQFLLVRVRTLLKLDRLGPEAADLLEFLH